MIHGIGVKASEKRKPNLVLRVRKKFLKELRSKLRLDNEQALVSLEGCM